MFGFTSEQIGSAVRWAVGLGGSYLATNFGLATGDITALSGALATIAMIVWSLWIKRPAVVSK